MLYDLFIGGLLLVTAYRGATKGIAWQVAGIAALVLCFLFATPLSLSVAPSIGLEPPLNRWVAMLGIYLLFSFGTFSLARSFRKFLEKSQFVEFDRHLGAVFGVIKGVTLALTITFFVVAMSEEGRKYILTTHTGYASAIIMDAMHPVMPEELHAVLEPYIHQLDLPGMPLVHADHDHDGLPDHVDDHHDLDDDHSEFGDPFFPNRGNSPNGMNDDDVFGPPRDGGAAKPSDQLAREREFLSQLIRDVPTIAERGLENLILEAIRTTPLEEQAALAETLRRALPQRIESVTRSWIGENPEPIVPATESKISNAELVAERKRLVREISSVFSNFEEGRIQVAEDIELSLNGLPSAVATDVLRDWHSDLLGVGFDPDPQTDLTTSIDTRIVRQLARAGIPRSELPQALQTRLGLSRQ